MVITVANIVTPLASFATSSYKQASTLVKQRTKDEKNMIKKWKDKKTVVMQAGRLLRTRYTSDNQSEIVQSIYSYDELGRVASQKLNSQKELVSYIFNVRGWLKEINSPKFRETLYYENPLNQGTACYNGNISVVSSQIENKQESIFRYTYDGLNRLLESTYTQAGGNWDLSESFRYDKMGNITNLQRYGQSEYGIIYWQLRPPTVVHTFGHIDDLDFTYSGNQVVAIQNSIAPNYNKQPSSFQDYACEDEEYSYDKNGNMIKDLNKDIITIRYNSLNLPEIIQTSYGNTTEYVYSSTGMKLRTIHKTSRTDLMVPIGMIIPVSNADLLYELTTDYVGNKIYENGSLRRVLTETGYRTYPNEWHYTYLKDHLGNNCLVLDVFQNINQQAVYNASGAFVAPYTFVNPYLYNGKEFDSMHGLNLFDFQARLYDQAIMRTTTPDPLAEKYPWISPYAYCGNNPVNRVDRNGMEWETTYDEEYARQLQQGMTNRMNFEQKSLDKLSANIVKNQEKGKDVSKDQAKAAGMQANIDNLSAGISELKAMGDTKDQMFTFNKVSGDVGKAEIKDGVIVMSIAGNGNIANGIHESSHGFDIWKTGMPKTPANFYSAETKAYGRQFSFGGKSTMPYSEWGGVSSLRDVTTNWVIGITDSSGDYMYPKQILGDKYNKAIVKSLLFGK